MSVTTTDTELIRQAQAGGVAAFGILVSRYQQYVFTLTLRYIPLREEAEEVAQDVFVKAFRSLQQFRQESKFSTWLYAIVHTTCLSHLRKKERPVIALEESKLAGLAAQRHAPAATALSEQRSRSRLIADAMKRLPPEDAQLLTLYYQAEQSVEEISRITGLSAGNIKVKLHRSRHRLKEILAQRYPGEIVHLMHV